MLCLLSPTPTLHTQAGATVFRLNTLRPTQNPCHFIDDIFKCIFLNANIWIPIKISLKFVFKGPINNIPALVQIMAWHLVSAKPLSEPMVIILLMHICVTRPQWVNPWRSERYGCSFKMYNFQAHFGDYLELSCEIALTNTPQYYTDDKSTLVQMMVWCSQVTSHYLKQCWHRWCNI